MLKLKEGFERNQWNLQKTYESRLDDLRKDLELRRKMEIHEIEERKNGHINDLLRNHEKAITLMRQYYNSITRDNLALIKSLEDEIELLKVKHEHNEKALEEISKKNEELTKPLEETAREVDRLRESLKNYQKQKNSLHHARARVTALEDQFKSMTADHKLLQKQYGSLEHERDHLYNTFESTVVSIRDRSEHKNKVLEQMLDEYKEKFETKRTEFTSVLRASNPDPVVLHNVTKKLDDVLTAKNEQIKELKYETAKVTKAHNDLVRVYEDKLRALGIPDNELGLEPLIAMDPSQSGPGNAPADLLVA
jgi:chromosome segregation ATPase